MSIKYQKPKGSSRRQSLKTRYAQCQNYWRKAAEKEKGFQKKLLLFAAGPAALPVAIVVVLLAILSIVGGIVLAVGDSSAQSTSADPEDISSSEWVEPEADKTYNASSGVINTTEFAGTVLPESEDAGDDYVDGTLFLGDSNTVRFMMYGKTTLKNDIGVVSMGAGAITTLGCVDFQGYSQYVTMPKAVAIMQPERVIITFGTNNLSGTGTDASSFIETYQKGIQAIVDAYPSVDIIVNSIPPLDKQRENTNLYQSQIDAYNKAIVTMCETNGWKYLNSAETLKDSSTGWAKTDYTLSDGVHLSQKGVDALFEYIRTHSYVTKDDRPKPLKTVPTRNETPVGLITSDPIAVRGVTRVPVEFEAGEGGTLEGATSQSVKKGSSCSAVKAVAESGYHFSYWSASLGSAGSSATLVFTVPSDADANGVLLTAHFEKDEAEATATPTDEPTATPAPAAATATATPTSAPALPTATVAPTVAATPVPAPTATATPEPVPPTATPEPVPPTETPVPVEAPTETTAPASSAPASVSESTSVSEENAAVSQPPSGGETGSGTGTG